MWNIEHKGNWNLSLGTRHVAFDEGYAVAGVVRRLCVGGLELGLQRDAGLISDDSDYSDGVFIPQSLNHRAGLVIAPCDHTPKEGGTF